MKNSKLFLFISIFFLISINSYSQQELNLADLFLDKKIEAVNRTILLYGNNHDAVEMDAKQSDGLGILEDVEFKKGTIEVEILGENNPGKSFIGIAFNIQSDKMY